MSKIVESYIKLNEAFQKCAFNQFEGDFSFDDMRVYYMLLDDFVKIARENYSSKDLDVSSAIELFNSDSVIQEELKQYEANENSEVKKR